MLRKVVELNVVSWMGIIEIWVFCFLCVKMVIESMGFLMDFGNQGVVKKGVKVGWIVRFWFRKYLFVDEFVDGDGFYIGRV